MSCQVPPALIGGPMIQLSSPDSRALSLYHAASLQLECELAKKLQVSETHPEGKRC